jgi:hypothetical protein
MLLVNLSSFLLALPSVLYHYLYGHVFSDMETSLLVRMVLASWTYHTLREIHLNAKNVHVMVAYGIDHYFINCGLWYFINRDVYDMGWGVHSAGYVLWAYNEFAMTPANANIFTLYMFVIVYIRALWVSSWVQRYVLGVATAVAMAAYDGDMNVVNRLTPWPEWKKCMWHGGMGVIVLLFAVL